jgi:hypothetical protein
MLFKGTPTRCAACLPLTPALGLAKYAEYKMQVGAFCKVLKPEFPNSQIPRPLAHAIALEVVTPSLSCCTGPCCRSWRQAPVMKTKGSTVVGQGCFLCRAGAGRLLVFGAKVVQVLAHGAVASLPWAACPAAVSESPCFATWLMPSRRASRPSAVSTPQSHLNQFKRSGTLG